jgi:hypothetical protein
LITGIAFIVPFQLKEYGPIFPPNKVAVASPSHNEKHDGITVEMDAVNRFGSVNVTVFETVQFN